MAIRPQIKKALAVSIKSMGLFSPLAVVCRCCSTCRRLSMPANKRNVPTINLPNKKITDTLLIFITPFEP